MNTWSFEKLPKIALCAERMRTPFVESADSSAARHRRKFGLPGSAACRAVLAAVRCRRRKTDDTEHNGCSDIRLRARGRGRGVYVRVAEHVAKQQRRGFFAGLMGLQMLPFRRTRSPHTHTRARTRVHTRRHTQPPTHTYPHPPTHPHTHTHTQTHPRTHTRTHIQI